MASKKKKNSSTKYFEIIVILFWLLIFILIFSQLNIFYYKNIPVSGINWIRYSIRGSSKPQYLENVKNIFLSSNNQKLDVELKPNITTLFDGWDVKLNRITHIHINSDGFRDYEYTKEKKKNMFRVIILGDSFTFGSGLELNETYSKILEKRLNFLIKNRYEVLNFGVPGYALSNEVEQLRVKALNYSPDLIIIGITLANDFKLNHSSNQLIDCLKERKLCDSRLENQLNELHAITSNLHIPVLLVVINDIRYNNESEKLLMKLSEEYGFYFLSFDFIFTNIPKEKLEIFYPYDGHLSPLGHTLIADGIYKFLITHRLM